MSIKFKGMFVVCLCLTATKLTTLNTICYNNFVKMSNSSCQTLDHLRLFLVQTVQICTVYFLVQATCTAAIEPKFEQLLVRILIFSMYVRYVFCYF